jgi:hypothetical protein
MSAAMSSSTSAPSRGGLLAVRIVAETAGRGQALTKLDLKHTSINNYDADGGIPKVAASRGICARPRAVDSRDGFRDASEHRVLWA